MMRSAISPRLAMRIFLNIYLRFFTTKETKIHEEKLGCVSPSTLDPDGEQRLAVFHGLSILHETFDDLACGVRLDLIHQLHRFHDAKDLPVFDAVAGLDERRRP